MNNPLVSWAWARFRREPKSWAALVMFLLLFYGLVSLTLLIWTTSFPRKAESLFTSFHYEAWSVNLMVLLLWAPARLAQSMARERERGTLDMLRLTGLSQRSLALGHAGVALMLPLLACAGTLPIVLLGIGGADGIEAVIRGYTSLFLCVPAYVLAAGIVGLSTKKAQNAGSAAVFLCMVALGTGLFLGPWRILKPIALLSPWGGGLAATSNKLFTLNVLGSHQPGELLQAPFMLALSLALLIGLSRRIGGEPAVILGRRGAFTLACGVVLVAALTFSPNAVVDDWWRVRPASAAPPATGLFSRYLVLWFVLLLLAIEIPVGWRDLVRGLWRSDPDDPPLAYERLTPLRFALGPALVVAFTLATAWGLWVSDELDPGIYLVSTLVIAASWLLAALTFQAASLLTRDEGMPRLIAVLGLLGVWCGPLAASLILGEMGVGAEFLKITRLPNPIYGLYQAAFHAELSAQGSALDPLSVGLGTAVVQGVLAYGVWLLVQRGRASAQEEVASMVALPADAYAAPGALTQRCDRGHPFTAEWASCPHCEPAGATPPPASP